MYAFRIGSSSEPGVLFLRSKFKRRAGAHKYFPCRRQPRGQNYVNWRRLRHGLGMRLNGTRSGATWCCWSRSSKAQAQHIQSRAVGRQKHLATDCGSRCALTHENRHSEQLCPQATPAYCRSGSMGDCTSCSRSVCRCTRSEWHAQVCSQRYRRRSGRI
jgi:hypothetical protein